MVKSQETSLTRAKNDVYFVSTDSVETMNHDIGAVTKKTAGQNFLYGRKGASSVREKIEADFDDIRKGGLEVLDFSKVEIVDFSGADEVVAKLAGRMEQGEYGQGSILLTGCNDGVRENIQVALQQKDLCLMHVEGKKKWSLVGVLNPYLQATLDIVMRDGSLLARDLASELNLKLNTASTRLINLFDKHLVLRKEDPQKKIGREFTYVSLLSALP